MSRTTWTVDLLQSGNVWVSDGTIYKPNEDTSIGDVSNTTIIDLADGTQAIVSPEVLYHPDIIELTWLGLSTSDDLTFISKIRTYARNGDYLKITTHLSTTLIGQFIHPKRVWLSGAEYYDLQVNFFRFSGSE